MSAGTERFDDTARALHATALDHVSAHSMAQLRQRRRLALAGGAARRPSGSRPLAWGGAFAVLAAAIALPLALRMPQSHGPDAAPPQPVAVAGIGVDEAATVGALEEDPDLYLWLASKDAIALASE